jgi:hypothetical protein
MNEGIVRGVEERSQKNTTPTTLDEFASAVFAPVYNSAAQAKSGSA